MTRILRHQGVAELPAADYDRSSRKGCLPQFLDIQLRQLHQIATPYEGLYEGYSTNGLVFVRVHTPEFASEKLPQNVADAVTRFQIHYSVAIDSNNLTWRSYGNQFWPRQTIVDSAGAVRWEHAREGNYDGMGEMVERLLKEIGVMVLHYSPNS